MIDFHMMDLGRGLVGGFDQWTDLSAGFGPGRNFRGIAAQILRGSRHVFSLERMELLERGINRVIASGRRQRYLLATCLSPARRLGSGSRFPLLPVQELTHVHSHSSWISSAGGRFAFNLL